MLKARRRYLTLFKFPLLTNIPGAFLKTHLFCLVGALALCVGDCALAQNSFYFQDFSSAVADGQTNFTDGSTFLTTRTGTTNIGVVGTFKELQFTEPSTGMISAYILPVLGGSNAPITAFSAKWNAVIAGNFPNAADGFSFNFGPFVISPNLLNPIYAQESGYTNGISFCVQTYQNSNPGFYVRSHGATLASAPYNSGARWGTNNFQRHYFEVDWSIVNGMTVQVDHQVIFSNVLTPGYTPQIGDRFVWAARSGGLTEYVRMDNFTVVTGGNYRKLTVGSPYFQDAAAKGSGFGAFIDPTIFYWSKTNAGYVGGTLSSAKAVRAYAITTDNQIGGVFVPPRPAQWTLQSSANSGSTWGGSNPTVSMRLTNYSETSIWPATDTNAYATYRLNVTTNCGAPSDLYISVVELFEVAPAPPLAVPAADQGYYNFFGPSGHVQQPSFSFNVYPAGMDTAVTFDWGNDTSYGTTFTTNLAASWPPVAVQAPLGRYLEGDKDYHCRITAQNAGGTIQTSDQTFHVPAYVPVNFNSFYTNYSLGNHSLDSYVVAADFNRDGKMDLLVSGADQYFSQDISWEFLNNFFGEPTRPDFRPANTKGLSKGDNPQSWGSLWVDDFNNDDRLDIFASGCAASQIYRDDGYPYDNLWLGNDVTTEKAFPGDTVAPDTNHWSFNGFLQSEWFNGGIEASVSVDDFNGDGRKDILLANGGNPAVPTFNPPRGPFPPVPPTLFFQSHWSHLSTTNAPGYDPMHFTPATTLPKPAIVSPGGHDDMHQHVVEGDYDNDGNIDIILCPGGLFHNDGFGNFTHVTNAFLGASTPYGGNPEDWMINAAWGDFDNDGKLDVVIQFWYDKSVLFRNLGNGVFTNTGVVFITSYAQPDNYDYDPVLAVADIDHDGRLDLYERWQTGSPNVVVSGSIFRNQGGGVFANEPVPSIPLAASDVACGLLNFTRQAITFADFNNDGRLDFAETGGLDFSTTFKATTWITFNLRGTSNQPPTAPTGLSSTTGSGSATLNWGHATDDVTPASSLTYNVRIGTSPDADDMMPSLSQPNGTRRVTRPGNKWLAHTATFRLPPGTYYWSVQTVDGSFAGSPFAPDQTFTITDDSQPHFSDILEVVGGTATNTSVGITMWTGYESAVCTLEYGLTTNYDHLIAQTFVTNEYFPLQTALAQTPGYLATNVVAVHRFATTNLLPLVTSWTNYHWRVTVSNSVGVAIMTDGIVFSPPPHLTIISNPSQVALQWPDPGFVLQYKNALSDPAWLTNAAPPIFTNGYNTVTLSNNTPTRFFRLKSQ